MKDDHTVHTHRFRDCASITILTGAHGINTYIDPKQARMLGQELLSISKSIEERKFANSTDTTKDFTSSSEAGFKQPR